MQSAPDGGAAQLQHPYGPAHLAVLHIDADSFFCQVEVLRSPALAGRPLAVRQDRDVISVNYPARAAGVKKHMSIEQTRALLAGVGGAFPHVFTTPDGRVSYQPYREASGALMRLLASDLPPALAGGVLLVEKASIDEAFLLVDLRKAAAAALAGGGADDAEPSTRHKAAAGAAAAAGAKRQQPQQAAGAASSSMAPGLDVPLCDMAAWVQQHQQQAAVSWDLSAAVALSEGLRALLLRRLGLTVSVGVAPNRLLAKLASRAAKPDGVCAVDSVAAVQRVLAAEGVERLPGLGQPVAAALQRAGLTRIVQLQTASPAQLAACLGLAGSSSSNGQPGSSSGQAGLLARLSAMAWGRDTTPVVPMAPRKSIQVQMTLSVHRMAASAATAAAAAGSNGGGEPPAVPPARTMPRLLTGCPDSLPRITAVLTAMSGDMLGRVMLERHTEGRWPTRLIVGLQLVADPTAALASAAQPSNAELLTAYSATRSVSRSAPFPSISLAAVAPLPSGPRAPQQQQEQQPMAAAPPPAPPAASAAAAFDAPGVLSEKAFPVSPQLQAATSEAAASLAQAIFASLPTRHSVLQANLSATQFVSVDSLKPAGGDIRKHFLAAAPAAGTAGAGAGGAQQEAGGSRSDAAASASPAKRQRQQQHHQEEEQQPEAAAASPAANKQPVEAGASPPPAAGAAASGHHHEHHHQPVSPPPLQHQQQQPCPQPPPPPPARQQSPPRHVALHPPARLSQLLRGLCDPALSGQAALADLERLLDEAGALAAAAGDGGDGGAAAAEGGAGRMYYVLQHDDSA